ncbi:WapI family immunity protein [Nocardia paucivorans]|uniref:WapI family immunity protein n=1 Tax=Nocardia paucivorans TaxID=114259 RepID=UPI000309CC57|nr:hypothetical protein [Nocardia paucivorans]
MKLIDCDGYGVELSVADYQFPEHTDPRIRYSWLVIAGSANCPLGNWSFRWQALTLDDAVELGHWLRRLAERDIGAADDPDGTTGPARLTFTEPNLVFAGACRAEGDIDLHIGLDLEFSPPWRKRTSAGDPSVVTVRLAPEAVATAADEWIAEVDGYLPPGGRLPWWMAR